MFETISQKSVAHLMAFSVKKKLAFLLLLYERVLPDLRTFFLAENLDLSVFEKARERFWQALTAHESTTSWVQLREEILSATPDSEDYGSLDASFALNAALVAATVAAFISDPQDSYVVEAMRYVRESLDANAISEKGALVYDRTVADYAQMHPLLHREARVEEGDITFLGAIPDTSLQMDGLSMLQHRATTQGYLLGAAR